MVFDHPNPNPNPNRGSLSFDEPHDATSTDAAYT
jgi:hypothetical protein